MKHIFVANGNVIFWGRGSRDFFKNVSFVQQVWLKLKKKNSRKFGKILRILRKILKFKKKIVFYLDFLAMSTHTG